SGLGCFWGVARNVAGSDYRGLESAFFFRIPADVDGAVEQLQRICGSLFLDAPKHRKCTGKTDGGGAKSPRAATVAGQRVGKTAAGVPIAVPAGIAAFFGQSGEFLAGPTRHRT